MLTAWLLEVTEFLGFRCLTVLLPSLHHRAGKSHRGFSEVGDEGVSTPPLTWQELCRAPSLILNPAALFFESVTLTLLPPALPYVQLFLIPPLVSLEFRDLPKTKSTVGCKVDSPSPWWQSETQEYQGLRKEPQIEKPRCLSVGSALHDCLVLYKLRSLSYYSIISSQV